MFYTYTQVTDSFCICKLGLVCGGPCSFQCFAKSAEKSKKMFYSEVCVNFQIERINRNVVDRFINQKCI